MYNWGSWLGGEGIAAQEWAEHQVLGGEQLHCTSLALYILLLVLLLLLLLLSLFCPVKQSLSQLMRFYLFLLILLPIALEGVGVSERLCGALLQLGLNHDISKNAIQETSPV